jgi:hypothetical protein
MNFAGTAARSSAIATPTTGMVSYVGTTGTALIPQIETYTGAAWQTPYGNTLINTTSFAAQTSVSFSSLFTSAYDNYEVYVNIDSVSTTLNVNLRMRSNTTDDTSANYYFTGISTIQTTGTVSTNNGNATTSATLFTVSAVNSSKFTLFNPLKATPTSFPFDSVGQSGDLRQNKGGGFFALTTVFNGFSLVASTGTMTGTVRVYGVRNS